jgi:hypothetical protein
MRERERERGLGWKCSVYDVYELQQELLMQPLRLLRRPYRLVKTLPNPLAKKETVWIVSATIGATISNVRFFFFFFFFFFKQKLG